MFARLMGLRTISPGKLHELMQLQPPIVIDVNAPQHWMKQRVPGALNLDPVGYTISDLPADKQSRLVFYCSNPMCRKAPNAARRAEKMGYRNVSVMPAGITGWVDAGLPTARDGDGAGTDSARGAGQT
jgi:rhodanese-related sulfurtransferase